VVMQLSVSFDIVADFLLADFSILSKLLYSKRFMRCATVRLRPRGKAEAAHA
jgi:hypothetical protein